MLNSFLIGRAGDSLGWHSEMKFSTHDVDNDPSSGNCAQSYHGAWWFNASLHSNLNGDYFQDQHHAKHMGIYWYRYKGTKYSYKAAEMKEGFDQN